MSISHEGAPAGFAPEPPLLVWRDPGPAAPAPALPEPVARLVEAVRAGTAAGMFPPTVVAGPEHTLLPTDGLAGEEDARTVAHALADPRFAPLRALVTRLDRWCHESAARAGPEVAPGVLTITNGALFGPVVSECLLACVTRPPAPARRLAVRRGAQYQAFLRRFLARLERDLAGPTWPAGPAWRGPVTALRADGEESHNGGQRVLRLDLAGGARIAYKPRPASGEAFFLAPETSVFALLNRLPGASGRIRLPTLPTWTRAGTDPGVAGYCWQEWVDAPPGSRVVRSASGRQLRGTVLSPARADRFWHRTGALAAVCFALGVTDLHSSNILVGTRRDDREPAMYPVDLEAYFAGDTRLSDTGLVEASGLDLRKVDPDRLSHHVGLETEARWCRLDGPPACWWRAVPGVLELRRRTAPLARTVTRSTVADTRGREGYGPYLPALLRGMFDAWTLLHRHRAAVRRFLSTQAGRHSVRVILRLTADYVAALRWRDQPEGQFQPAESAQLAQGDVPYFFRAATGGPLWCVAPAATPGADPPTGREWDSSVAVEVDVHLDGEPPRPPQPTVPEGMVPLTGLGPALRDAVAHAFDDLPELEVHDPAYRTRLRVLAPGEGQASFEWPEQDRRITYRWTATKVRVRIDELSAPAPPAPVPGPGGEVRHRLLRLDHLDQALRVSWVSGARTDSGQEEKLRRLTDAGLAWLRTVVEEHGWPGKQLVGSAAAAAACRLVQHAEGQLAFRRRCLALAEEAAAARDLPRREVAYLTDTLRLAGGEPQRYGTKFERVGDALVPCPLEDPEGVEERRAAMGLEPLPDYAHRLEVRFAIPAHATAPPATGKEAAR